MTDDGPCITVGESAWGSVLDALGMYVGTDEIIRDAETDEPVPSQYDGKPVSIRNLGGVVHDEDSVADAVLIRDDITEIVEYVKDDRNS